MELNIWGEPATKVDLGVSRRGSNNRKLALHRPTVSRVKVKPFRKGEKPIDLQAYRFDGGKA